MKTTVDLFDIVLLVVLLGLMLPFLFGATTPLVDMRNWGFEAQDDKTMKLSNGDMLTENDGAIGDGLSAAEIVLMTKVVNRETVKPSRYSLPNGVVVTVDGDYIAYMDNYTKIVQGSLDPSQLYKVKYDYTADIWRIY